MAESWILRLGVRHGASGVEDTIHPIESQGQNQRDHGGDRPPHHRLALRYSDYQSDEATSERSDRKDGGGRAEQRQEECKRGYPNKQRSDGEGKILEPPRQLLQ